MSTNNQLVGLLLCIILVACNGNSGPVAPNASSGQGTSSAAEGEAVLPSVKVYKSDESVQCEQGGISLEAMQRELTDAGIDVQCAQTGHDGLARISMCGAGTGNINIFSIHQANLQDAMDLGFMPVSQLDSYQDSECRP